MTTFLEAIEENDGYNGHKVIYYLCQDLEHGQVWAVWYAGYFRWSL